MRVIKLYLCWPGAELMTYAWIKRVRARQIAVSPIAGSIAEYAILLKEVIQSGFVRYQLYSVS